MKYSYSITREGILCIFLKHNYCVEMALDQDIQMTSGIQGGVDATPSHNVFCQFYQGVFFYQYRPFSVAVHISLHV